jgi:hypothetical protein
MPSAFHSRSELILSRALRCTPPSPLIAEGWTFSEIVFVSYPMPERIARLESGPVTV